MVINEWPTEYKSRYNTCLTSSDKLISNTVLYNLYLSIARDESHMLNETTSYNEVDFDINSLQMKLILQIKLIKIKALETFLHLFVCFQCCSV